MKSSLKLIVILCLWFSVSSGTAWAIEKEQPEDMEIESPAAEEITDVSTPEVPEQLQEGLETLREDRQTVKDALMTLLENLQGLSPEKKHEAIEAWKEQNADVINDLRARAQELREQLTGMRPDTPEFVDGKGGRDLSEMRNFFRKKAQEMMGDFEPPEEYEMPDMPEMPDMSEMPEMPEMPDMSEMPNMSEMFERPDMSERFERPDMSERFERPDMSEMFEMPDIPDMDGN